MEVKMCVDICVEPSGLERSSRCSEPPIEGQMGEVTRGLAWGLGTGIKQKALQEMRRKNSRGKTNTDGQRKMRP